MAKAFPERENYRRDLAGIANNEGIRLHKQGKLDDASNRYKDALAILDTLSANYQQRFDCQLEIARTEKNLAVVLSSPPKSQLGAAEHFYEQSADRLRHLLARPATDPMLQDADDAALLLTECRKELGQINLNLAIMQGDEQPAKAFAAYKEAIALFDALAKASPDVPEYGYLLATAYRNRAGLFSDLKQFPAARADLTTARGLLEALKPYFAATPLYRLDLARCYLALADANLKAELPLSTVTDPWNAVVDLLEEQSSAASGRETAEARNLYLGAIGNLLHVYDRSARQAEEMARWSDVSEALQALLTVRSRYARALPSPENRMEEASTRLRLAGIRLRAFHDHAGAAAALAGLPGDVPPTWGKARAAATFLGYCMDQANNDVTLTEAERTKLIQTYGDHCLKLLSFAVEHEWREMKPLTEAAEFNLLRDRREFQELSEALERKQK